MQETLVTIVFIGCVFLLIRKGYKAFRITGGCGGGCASCALTEVDVKKIKPKP